MKVCHLTSVHGRFDSRIFQKQCRSLARAGYEVDLVAAEPGADEIRDGVRIHLVRRNAHKLARFTATVYRIFRKALDLNADLYHFHDPELVFAGLLLKLRGKRVIYDIHEDYSSWLTFNRSIPAWLRKPAAWCIRRLENLLVGKYDALVTVTPEIAQRFSRLNPATVLVRNFPLAEEFRTVAETVPWESRDTIACNIGTMSRERGFAEMIEAVSLVRKRYPMKLVLGGILDAPSREYYDSLPPERKEYVEWLGYTSRDRMREVFSRARVGLIIHHPVKNFLIGYPTKLFEFMSAGLPVVCSDFPVLRELDAGVGCCIHVDPLDPRAIADAIVRLLERPGEAEAMGQRGRKAVQEKYSWEAEEKALLSLYSRILKP